jgi:hypothetical protein
VEEETMRELVEMLNNTETGMWMYHIANCGMQVAFLRKEMRYDFIISDVDLGTSELSLEEHILEHLEKFLDKLGVKTHA